ncbi:MAG: polyprenyl synthetase, partial [Actinobacteria bacterium]
GIFGDPHVTGKPAGDDLIEGKRTALLALTWRNASSFERETIMKAFHSQTEISPSLLNDIRAIVDKRGRTAHEKLISSLVNEGLETLSSASLSAHAQDLLTVLGELLTRRHT